IESFIFYLRDVFYAIFSGYNVKFSYTMSEKKNVASIVIDFAEKNSIDVIVTGTRKLKGIERLILGSVSQAIIAESKIPVIVVPP
ncbi:MAG: universal stress protein, partial [Thermoplasmata archaeon]